MNSLEMISRGILYEGKRVFALWNAKSSEEIEFLTLNGEKGWHAGDIVSVENNETWVTFDKDGHTWEVKANYMQGWFQKDQLIDEYLPKEGVLLDYFDDNRGKWLPGVVHELKRTTLIIRCETGEDIEINPRIEGPSQSRMGRIRPRDENLLCCRVMTIRQQMKLNKVSVATPCNKRKREKNWRGSLKRHRAHIDRISDREAAQRPRQKYRFHMNQRVVAKWGFNSKCNGDQNDVQGDKNRPHWGRVIEISDDGTIRVRFDRYGYQSKYYHHTFDLTAQENDAVFPWFDNENDEDEFSPDPRPKVDTRVLWDGKEAMVIKHTDGASCSLELEVAANDGEKATRVTVKRRELFDGRLKPKLNNDGLSMHHYKKAQSRLPSFVKEIGKQVLVSHDETLGRRKGSIVDYGDYGLGYIRIKVDGDIVFMTCTEVLEFVQEYSEDEDSHIIKDSYTYQEIEQIIQETVTFSGKTFGVTGYVYRNGSDETAHVYTDPKIEYLLKALCRLEPLQKLVALKQFQFEAIQINMTKENEEIALDWHSHPSNSPSSAIFAVGTYNHTVGGHLALIDHPSSVINRPKSVKTFDIWHNLTLFDGSQTHKPCHFQSGWRCSIVYYSRIASDGKYKSIKESDAKREYLTSLGFALPSKHSCDFDKWLEDHQRAQRLEC